MEQMNSLEQLVVAGGLFATMIALYFVPSNEELIRCFRAWRKK